MRITAKIQNSSSGHHVVVQTDEDNKTVMIPAKETGKGSSINGGEFLCLALATCYCNDIYREAKKRNIDVISVNVDVWSEFGGIGEAASSILYKASIESSASAEDVKSLLAHTDTVAEIQNTLRKGVDVRMIN